MHKLQYSTIKQVSQTTGRAAKKHSHWPGASRRTPHTGSEGTLPNSGSGAVVWGNSLSGAHNNQGGGVKALHLAAFLTVGGVNWLLAIHKDLDEAFLRRGLPGSQRGGGGRGTTKCL